jgi:flavodoxin
MKSLIVYCSEYKNNTEKIAGIFAKKTDCEAIGLNLNYWKKIFMLVRVR